jgi:hypothetical protein
LLAIASCGTRGFRAQGSRLRALTEPSKLRAARCLENSVSLVLHSSLGPFLAMSINNFLLQILLGAEAVGPMSQVLEVIVGLLNIRGGKSRASRTSRDAGALDVVQSALPIQPVDLVDSQKSEGLGHEGEDNLRVWHGGGVGGFGNFGGFEDRLTVDEADISRNGGVGGCGRDCEGVHGGSRREGGDSSEEEREESNDGVLHFDRRGLEEIGS